jgi:hypothetical protein
VLLDPSRRRPSPTEGGARDLPVVERMDDAGDLLPLLVSLARDHHDISAAGPLDRGLDRGAAVGVDLDVGPGALEHLADDLEGIL